MLIGGVSGGVWMEGVDARCIQEGQARVVVRWCGKEYRWGIWEVGE